MINKCILCGKEFESKPSVKRKYCSFNCYQKVARTKNQNGKNNLLWLNLDIKEIINLYTIEKCSISSISKKMNVSTNVIRRRLKIENIYIRNYKEQKKIDTNFGRLKEYAKVRINYKSKTRNRKNYINIAKLNYKWICMLCGKDKTNNNFDLIVHHKDGNNKNNNIDNLMILCQNCHAYIHGKKSNNIKRNSDILQPIKNDDKNVQKKCK